MSLASCAVSNLVPTTYVASSNQLLPLTIKDALDLTTFPLWQIPLRCARSEYQTLLMNHILPADSVKILLDNKSDMT